MVKFLISRRGSILIETAFVMPILVVLLLSMTEFGEAFIIQRRNAQIASSAADLAAQAACLTNANLQDISNIGGTLLGSYSPVPLGLRISSVIQNASNATVQWSYASGTLSAAKSGAVYALPAGLITTNQTLIVAQTSYAFTPTIGSYLAGGVTFTSTAYNYPRVISAVPLKTSC